jgi:Helicase associated domain
VPTRWREDGYRLGGWVNNQRAARRRGDLDPERCVRLEALPGWVWDTKEAAWAEALGRLEAFVARMGHARVPQHHREDGLRLGSCVLGQRQAYRKGTLDAERRARLEALPGWVWDARERG